MRKRITRPSPALVVAMLALFVALGGVGYAAATINGKDIKNKTIAGKKLKNQAITAGKVKNKTLTANKVKDNTLTGTQINESKLGTVPSATSATTATTATSANTANSATSAGSVAGLSVFPLKRAAPTAGADQNAARAAAPKVPLVSKGPLSVYGKCFSSGGTLWVGTYIETTANGSVYDSRGSELTGGPLPADFLNPDSPETDRDVNDEDSVGANNTTFDNEDDNDFSALAPDGTSLRGLLFQGAKQGTVAFNGGAFGAGDGCVWGGSATS